MWFSCVSCSRSIDHLWRTLTNADVSQQRERRRSSEFASRYSPYSLHTRVQFELYSIRPRLCGILYLLYRFFIDMSYKAEIYPATYFGKQSRGHLVLGSIKNRLTEWDVIFKCSFIKFCHIQCSRLL